MNKGKYYNYDWLIVKINEMAKREKKNEYG